MSPNLKALTLNPLNIVSIMNDKPTPETDAAAVFPSCNDSSDTSHPQGTHVATDFAHKLERERDELAERLDFQRNLNRECIDQITSRTKERDEARDRADTMFANHADILDQARRERDYAREQRDKLAEALRELRDAEWLTMPGRANNIVEAALATLDQRLAHAPRRRENPNEENDFMTTENTDA